MLIVSAAIFIFHRPSDEEDTIGHQPNEESIAHSHSHRSATDRDDELIVHDQIQQVTI